MINYSNLKKLGKVETMSNGLTALVARDRGQKIIGFAYTIDQNCRAFNQDGDVRDLHKIEGGNTIEALRKVYPKWSIVQTKSLAKTLYQLAKVAGKIEKVENGLHARLLRENPDDATSKIVACFYTVNQNIQAFNKNGDLRQVEVVKDNANTVDELEEVLGWNFVEYASATPAAAETDKPESASSTPPASPRRNGRKNKGATANA